MRDDWSEELYATSLSLAGIARDPFPRSTSTS
jgi:hypothetical protein